MTKSKVETLPMYQPFENLSTLYGNNYQRKYRQLPVG